MMATYGCNWKTYFILTSCVLVNGLLALTTFDNSTSNTCPTFEGKESILLKNCSYNLKKVTCSVVYTARFVESDLLTNNRVFFKITSSFRVLNSSTENSAPSTNTSALSGNRRCLVLERTSLEVHNNLASQENGFSVSQVPISLILFSLAMDEIKLDAIFNTSEPMAEIISDEFCLSCNSSACSCNVRMLWPDGFLTDSNTGLHSEDFWIKLRNLVTVKLAGRVRRLHLIHGVAASIRVEGILPHLEGFGIEDLLLVGADWTSYERRHLPNMPELRILNISRNGIETIEQDAFLSMPILEVLILSNNDLKELPDSISSLKKLKILDLSTNKNLQVDSTIQKIKHLTSLKWLNMSRVPINSMELLNPLILNNSQVMLTESRMQLEGLILEKCGITIAQEDVSFFDNMSSLIELDLSRNSIQMLSSNMFRSLTHLQSLNLKANGFTVKFKLEVGESTPLKFLDLSRNKLKSIDEINITGAAYEVNLAGNALSEWNNVNIFLKSEHSNDTWVKKLNLSRNALTFVSENMASSFQHLEGVDLGGNPFNCDDCQIPTFQNWLLQPKDTMVLNLGTDNNLTCGTTKRRRTEIISIVFNNTACLPPHVDSFVNYLAVIWIPLLVVVSLVLLGIIGMYGYRFEIAYVRHLINIRRQRHIRENESISNYLYDAFVSYSVADREWVVRELQPYLEDGPEKYRLCLHERDFALGSIIADNIVECMKNSRSTLVVLSPHFVKSQWCRWELEVANHKLFEDDREFLILVELKKLDKKTLPQHLAYLLDTRTFLEWPEGPGPHPTAWKRLKYALGDSLYQRRMKAQDNGEHIDLTSHYDDSGFTDAYI
ncbi:toll-like receptor 2 [Periplaneta americana]|uniref:toll-like receptor 2 n=1 Tax=Periplaneta americana TaxID=6978 RepID=UPI0037E7BEB8